MSKKYSLKQLINFDITLEFLTKNPKLIADVFSEFKLLPINISFDDIPVTVNYTCFQSEAYEISEGQAPTQCHILCTKSDGYLHIKLINSLNSNVISSGFFSAI